MTDPSTDLRDRITRAIYGQGAYCGDCEYDGWDSCEDCRRCVLGYADVVLGVLRDLHAEPVGVRSIPVSELVQAQDLLYEAWTIIANAHEGNWDQATDEWRAAAIRWRDSWHNVLGADDA